MFTFRARDRHDSMRSKSNHLIFVLAFAWNGKPQLLVMRIPVVIILLLGEGSISLGSSYYRTMPCMSVPADWGVVMFLEQEGGESG